MKEKTARMMSSESVPTRVVKTSYLVTHVVKTARRLMDEITECSWEDLNILTISRKSITLENEVMILRKSYPNLPLWIDHELRRVNGEIAFLKTMGITRANMEPKPAILDLVDWHSHWSEVLRVLEGDQRSQTNPMS